MPDGTPNREQIDRFVVDKIDTVPQLEALLLIWRSRPRPVSTHEIARELYIPVELAESELSRLLHNGLIVSQSSQCYALNLVPLGREDMLAGLADLYRRELVRISNLIHAKAPRAMRDFASAFRFKKEEKK